MKTKKCIACPDLSICEGNCASAYLLKERDKRIKKILKEKENADKAKRCQNVKD